MLKYGILMLFATGYMHASDLSYLEQRQLKDLDASYADLHEKIYHLQKQGLGTPEQIINRSNATINRYQKPIGYCSLACCLSLCCSAACAIKEYEHGSNCEHVVKLAPSAIGLSFFAIYLCGEKISKAKEEKNIAEGFQRVTVAIQKYDSDQLKKYAKRVPEKEISEAFFIDFLQTKKMR